MNIKQLKQLIEKLPDNVEVLTWDRDTANPVERIIAHNITIKPPKGVKLDDPGDDWVKDFHTPPAAALILVCLD